MPFRTVKSISLILAYFFKHFATLLKIRIVKFSKRKKNVLRNILITYGRIARTMYVHMRYSRICSCSSKACSWRKSKLCLSQNLPGMKKTHQKCEQSFWKSFTTRSRFRILPAYGVIEVNEKTKRLRNTRTTHSDILVTFIKGMQNIQSANAPLKL